MIEELDSLCDEIMEDAFWIDECGNACEDVDVVISALKRAYEAGRVSEKTRCLDLVENIALETYCTVSHGKQAEGNR